MGFEYGNGLPYLPGGARGNGFTMVELLTTVSIIAVLLTIAAPAFRELIANQRVQAGAMDIYTGLVRARSEALKQDVNVTLSSASGNDWAGGWKVASASADLDQRGASTNVTIAGSVASVTYQPSGRITAGTVPTFAISATGTSAIRCVKVNLSGQPYVTKTACS
jgi:type IV fimbrial biogenesis protein FimT